MQNEPNDDPLRVEIQDCEIEAVYNANKIDQHFHVRSERPAAPTLPDLQQEYAAGERVLKIAEFKRAVKTLGWVGITAAIWMMVPARPEGMDSLSWSIAGMIWFLVAPISAWVFLSGYFKKGHETRFIIKAQRKRLTELAWAIQQEKARVRMRGR